MNQPTEENLINAILFQPLEVSPESNLIDACSELEQALANMKINLKRREEYRLGRQADRDSKAMAEALLSQREAINTSNTTEIEAYKQAEITAAIYEATKVISIKKITPATSNTTSQQDTENV